MLAATFAMTVTGLNEWRINLKPNAAAQATPANALAHSRFNSHPPIFQQLATFVGRRKAINVLSVHQGIRRRRAPIEEFRDRENCARRLVFHQRADRFSTRTICADREV